MTSDIALAHLVEEMHAFQPLRESLSEVVADQFREQIALGWWPVGQRLPAERELASELNVSRETVRQAVRLLTEEGAVVSQGPRSAPAVAPPGPAASQERLKDLDYRWEEFLDLHALRINLEARTARRAARHREDEHLALMIKAQGEMRTALALHRTDLFRAADSDFHLAVALASGSKFLRDEVRKIRATLFPPLDELNDANKLHISIEEHDQILTAIEDRAPDRAAEQMTVHLQQMGHRLADLVGQPVDSDPSPI